MPLRDALAYAKRLEIPTGLENYPIFEEDYRPRLNGLITDHYFFREIGYETPEMFFHALGRRMRTIMPQMNRAYLAIKDEAASILDTHRVKSKNSGSSENTASESGTSKSGSNTSSGVINSTFPQQMLASNGDYASTGTQNVTKGDSDTVNDAHSSSLMETLSMSESSGRDGSFAQLLNEYFTSLVNVDEVVIDRLSDLFMGIWAGGDSLTTNSSSLYLNPLTIPFFRR